MSSDLRTQFLNYMTLQRFRLTPKEITLQQLKDWQVFTKNHQTCLQTIKCKTTFAI